MKALRIYAGPEALAHIERDGLRPEHVRTIPGAAGGPKGLILGPLDRFIFGHWLAQSSQPVDLVGASIGAWRLATACVDDALAAFRVFEHDYIEQRFDASNRRPRPQALSAAFADDLHRFFTPERVRQVLDHPRYRLHVVTARGRHLLSSEGRLRTVAGYMGAYVSNGVHRRALGAWLERCVFSSGRACLPFDSADLRTRHVSLTAENFHAALQASCSIPFMLQAVHDIPGAPRGAHWDGGITHYHLHLRYANTEGIVLYPHFQRHVVPGWLDKALRWRHHASPALSRMVILAPDPAWIATLPGGKLPDRRDFANPKLGTDARIQRWLTAVAEADRLAQEWAQWLHAPDPRRVEPL